MPIVTRIALSVAIAMLPLAAQQQAVPATPAQDAPHYPLLTYPKDKDFVVATVDGEAYTLEQLVQYIERRHAPGFRDFLATNNGLLLLRSNLMAPWVRHYADIVALINEAVARKVDVEKSESFLSDALTRTFDSFLADYQKRRTDGQKPGTQLPPISQVQIANLRADFQMRYGLDSEVQGWLDYLEPADYTEAQLREFFTDNARVFGGMVTFAHIFVRNRDDGTGLLLDAEGQKQALARVAEIKARLLADGSNFREVARLRSEDLRTARDGGVLNNVTRFDQRLPAILCRTAWFLKDGEVSDVIETPYGYHLVQRIGFSQKKFMIFSPDMQPMVRQTMQVSRQEDLLLSVRKKHDVVLHL